MQSDLKPATAHEPIALDVLDALVNMDRSQPQHRSCVERLQHHVTAAIIHEDQPPIRLTDWRSNWGRAAKKMKAILEALGWVKVDGQDFLLAPDCADSDQRLLAAQGQLEYALVQVRHHLAAEASSASEQKPATASSSNTLLSSLAADRVARHGPPPPAANETEEPAAMHVAGSAPPSKRVKAAGAATCDRVLILRNGSEPDAPILHVKNYNRDRGLSFVTAAGIDSPSANSYGLPGEGAMQLTGERARKAAARAAPSASSAAGARSDAAVVVEDGPTGAEKAQIEKLSSLKAKGCDRNDKSYHEYLMALASDDTTERVMDAHRARYSQLTMSHVNSFVLGNATHVDGLNAMADEVMSLCVEAVRGTVGERAVRAQTPWMFSGTSIWYETGGKLVRHTDGGIGGWLVLFQVGATANFYVGDTTVGFESGDALVFRGATVMHGVDDTLPDATYGGQPAPLPKVLDDRLRGKCLYRVSVQARQA